MPTTEPLTRYCAGFHARQWFNISGLRRDAIRAARGLCAAALLLLLQACKLTLIAPQGGAIESLSGDHDCASGQTCSIDIPGIPFSDTFTATPNPGYRFVGWKDAPGYICATQDGACVLQGIPASFTEIDIDLRIEPLFEVSLASLLPQSTRGIFETFPGASGAMDTNVDYAPWGMGPLQVLQAYQAGMPIAANARHIMLAQLGNTPGAFILLALLQNADVDTLTAAIDTSAAGSYQGFPVLSIDDTNLQLAKLDDNTLAIAPQAALQLALDTHKGAASPIAQGPLGDYLLGLDSGQPNTFIYGLPALYATVPAPGSGDASLSQASVISTSFAVENGELSGLLGFVGANAQTYAATLNEQLLGYPGPTIYTLPSLNIIDLEGLSVTDDLLPLAKTLVLDMDAVDYSNGVVPGGNAPWLNFEVGATPPAIFINFEFTDPAQVAAFEAAHLPQGFSMVPFRMLQGEPLRYLMVLNIYQSSGGLVEGARAEWSVFVADPDSGEPRFMVVQAKAENLSADSITPGFLTFGEPVSYTFNGAALETYVGEVDPVTEVETAYFTASIPWPQPPANNVPFARTFMPANDLVFWGNAVADKTLFNSTAANRDGAVVPAGQFTFTDNSVWAGFLKPAPVHAVVYLNQQDIVISPWFNLEANYLDVSPQLLQDLLEFKYTFYPLTVKNIATAAIRGEDAALSSSRVSDSVPTVHYHFPLTDPSGLLTSVAGPGAYLPAAVELFAGESAGYYVTLSVYRREDDPCGLRAEWLTYIVGADGRPDSLRLDGTASDACLDPVALMSLATDVTQSIDGNVLDTSINTPFVQFEASIDLLSTDSALTSLNLLEAQERVCSLNNICDEFYYDGELVIVPATRANTVATQIAAITTPWDSYIDHAGARATVRQNASIQTFNPWRNLRPFAAPAAAP